MKHGQSAASASAEKTAGKTKVAGEPLYYLYKDTHGYEYKVANMANPIICKRKGIIEIECIRKSNTLEPNFSICTVTDRDMGIIFGVPNGIDPRTKEIRWQRFKIGDFRRYDLSKSADAIEWAVVSRAPWLIGSPFQKGKPYYKMHDREAEAKQIIAESKMRDRAMQVARSMVAISEFADMYRNFGKNPEGFSPTMLEAEILKIAERSPKEFLQVWEDANREVLTIFNRCESTGLIAFHPASANYMWKDSLPIGMTKQAAIKFLIDNKTVLSEAKIQSQDRDFTTKRLVKEVSVEKIEAKEEDEELTELRNVARIMKIDGFMEMDKDSLQEAVDAASASV